MLFVFKSIMSEKGFETEITLNETPIIRETEEKPLKESKNSGQKKSQKIKTSEFSASNFLDNLKEIEDENFKLLSGCSFKVEKSNITISTKSGLIYEILKEKEKIITIEELIKDFFNSKHKIKIVKIEEVNDSVDSEDFKFAEKKDKLFESETMKNLFSAFDCRVLNIEKDK